MYMEVIKVETDNDVKTFNKKIPKHGTVMVGFFMTHCPACIAFKPEWEKFVAHHKVHGKGDAIIAEVDSNQAANVDFDTSKLDGFPTVLVKNNNEDEAIMFNDKRESDALKLFLKKAMERKNSKSGGRKRKKKNMKNKRKKHRKGGYMYVDCSPSSELCCLKDGEMVEDMGPLGEEETYESIMSQWPEKLSSYDECPPKMTEEEIAAQKERNRKAFKKEEDRRRHQLSMVNPYDTTPTTLKEYQKQLRNGPGIWENLKGAIGDAFGMAGIGGRKKKKKKTRKSKSKKLKRKTKKHSKRKMTRKMKTKKHTRKQKRTRKHRSRK